MEKNKKSKRFLVPILFLVIVSIVVISSINTYINLNVFEKHIMKDIEDSKKKFIQRYKDSITKQTQFVNDTIKFKMSQVEEQLQKELYIRMNIARSICDFVYENYKDKLSTHKMRQMVAKQLSTVRFDKENRGYYFAYQNSTRTVYEHIHKETIGLNMANVKDTKGVNVALAHDKVLEGGKEIGLLHRYYYKPGNRKVGYPKLVSVTLYKPLDLLIGTGEYLDVVEKRMKNDVIKRYKNFQVNDNQLLAIVDLHNINGGKDFGTVLINSTNKQIQDTKISDDVVDSMGINFRKQYLKALKDKGYVYLDHWYSKKNESEQQKVKAYITLQKDWNWVIVSGFYFNKLDKEIEELENSLVEYTKNTILDSFIIILIVSIVVIAIAIFISLMIDSVIQRYTGELLKNKQRLELAQEVSKMGSWSLNIKNNTLRCSNEMCNIFEFEKEQKDLHLEDILNRMYPKDKIRIEKEYKNSIKMKQNFEITHRLLMKDGRVKIVEVKSEIEFDENGHPTRSNGTTQDITIEYERDAELKAKEKLLLEKEKLASMGEMIGNIAHQWRQPLSVISTCATGMSLKKEYNILKDEDIAKNCSLIDKNAQYLSATIDDFRNFIKNERVLKELNIKENIESFLHLVEGTKKSNYIEVIQDIDTSIKFAGYANELMQCYINIFNNSKDAFILNEIEDRKFFITVKKLDNKIIIELKDTAGGIPTDILSKVFDPYFTTKHKSKGTGLGLHMTYKFITDGMQGDISVQNSEFEYDGKNYNGALFSISLPLH